MKKRLIHIRETICTVAAEEDAFLDAAEAEIRAQRMLLENHIRRQPEFRASLRPIEVPIGAPEIARGMAAAAAKTGVGPMAAVAGVLAEAALRAMIAAGARRAGVDNGGDIAFLAAEPTIIGIFTGRARIRNIGLRFEPRPGIVSVCTSSGTVGHSLSFGQADAAVAIAPDAGLADAAATALGNAVRRGDPGPAAAAMETLLRAGVEGLLAVADDLLVIGGTVPEIVQINVPVDRISGARRGILHV